jgi:peptidoglycan/xylan/chitin deacetylase (PgdA/CDA1 family)
MANTRIAVLMYHAIQEQRSAISISPELFQWQMKWLSEHDIEVVSLEWLVSNLLGGFRPAKNTVVITFDDGYRDLLTYALPVLRQYKFPATIYLVTGYCGMNNDWPGQPDSIPRLPLLDWDQIQQMENSEIEFGVHTVNHPVLDKIDKEDAIWEIRYAKNTMIEHLGHPIRSFAYPYGRYNKRVKQLVVEEFANACSTNLGFVGTRFDPYAIERIDVSYFLNPAIFQRLFEPLAYPYLKARKLIRTLASNVLSRPWK